MNVPPLEPGCPWSALSGLAPPDIKWCEAPQCSWIVEPANSWSNLFYVVVAWLLWRWSKNRFHGAPLRWFAPSALLVGLFSFVYHASYTFFFQVFDFVGMFLFLGLVLAINLRRLRVAPVGPVWSAVIATGTVMVFLFRWQGLNIQPIVGAFLLAIVASEAVCRLRRTDRASYGWYAAALVLLAVAGVFSLLDVTRTWCNPDDHLIQGHAIWHLLGAASMLPLYRFYESVLDQ